VFILVEYTNREMHTSEIITDQPHYSLILERHVSKYEYLTELIYLRKTCE